MPGGIAAGVLLFAMVWVQREVLEAEAPTLLPPVEVEQDAPTALPAPQVLPELEPTNGKPGTSGIFSLPAAPPEAPAVTEAPPRPVADDTAGPGAPEPEPERVAAAVDTVPVPVHSPRPVYPRRSRRLGEGGEVLVQALVGPDGRPRQVQVARSSSYRALDQAAVRAVRRWRFQPAMREGAPVTHPVQIPVTFNP